MFAFAAVYEIARMAQADLQEPVPPVWPVSAAGDSAALLDRSRTVGRRLATDLRTAMSFIPLEYRRVRAAAVWLKIDANIVQRVMAASKADVCEFEFFRRLPGIESLRTLARACRRRGANPLVCQTLDTSIDMLDRLTLEFGGNLSSLRRRLDEAQGGTAPNGHAASRYISAGNIRQGHFELSRQFIGRSCETALQVCVVQPDPKDGSCISGMVGHAILGCTMRNDGQPLSLSLAGFDQGQGLSDQAQVLAAQADRAVIRELSSSPLPKIAIYPTKIGCSMVIDPANSMRTGPFDLAILTPRPATAHPDRLPQRTLNHITRIGTPTRRLVLDYVMHRSLARTCLPIVRTFLWSATFADADLRSRWYEQLPDSPSLQLLTPEFDTFRHGLPIKGVELARRTLAEVEATISQFVIFRLDVSYPIWGVSYVLSFEFGETAT